jgi:hypothetical protein
MAKFDDLVDRVTDLERMLQEKEVQQNAGPPDTAALEERVAHLEELCKTFRK